MPQYDPHDLFTLLAILSLLAATIAGIVELIL